MKISFPFAVAGTVKLLRYQPIPPGSAPPPVPAGAFSLNSPSMLQSCGRSSRRHRESSRPVSCPFVTSPRLKRQSRLNETRFPGRELAKEIDAAKRMQHRAMFSFLIIGSKVYLDRIYKSNRNFKMNPVNPENILCILSNVLVQAHPTPLDPLAPSHLSC